LASELGASQISTLLETLPGIANVLRSPVADALLNVIRAAARVGEFQLADAEELIKYATRRGLVGQEEGDRVLIEVREAAQRRAEKAAEKGKAAKTKAKIKPKAAPKKAPKKKK
jgi:urease accessory protein UreF